MFCVYCGTKNPDESSVCLFCGQRVSAVQTHTPVQTQAAPATAPAPEPAPAEKTAKIPVYTEPDARTGATIAIKRYSNAMLEKSKPAPWYAAFQRHPVAVLMTVILTIVLLVTAISLWQWAGGRSAQSQRMESVLKDAADLQSRSAGFTKHIQQLRSGPAPSMMEYHDQCIALEALLGDANSANEKGMALLDQAIPDFQDDQKISPVLNNMRKVLELDKRVQTDVKQETLLAKTLTHLEPNEQSELFAQSIKPLQDDENQLIAQEQQALAQVQNESKKLPSNLSRLLSNP